MNPPSPAKLVKCSLTVHATILYLGKSDGERKGHSGNPDGRFGPLTSPLFRGCGSAPPFLECPFPKNPIMALH